jgi:hypothetical protein
VNCVGIVPFEVKDQNKSEYKENLSDVFDRASLITYEFLQLPN